MDKLDSALNELGMLSCVTKYKIDYLQSVETAAEVRRARARSGSLPQTSDKDVTINVNSDFVTNVSICNRTPPDLSPFMKRKLQLEIEERRLTDFTKADNNSDSACDRHKCHSSHICAYVSPRRNRTVIRSMPYSYGYASSKFSPFFLRPSVAPLSGVLLSSASSRSLGRLR